MIREFAPVDVYYLLLAARWTLALTGLAFVGGALVGLSVALLRVSHVAALRAIGVGYVYLVQGVPLLAWLFVFFFGIPILAGVRVSAWIAAMVAPIPVRRSDAFGVPSDAREAMAFAVLADMTLRGQPAWVPPVTGATAPKLLGKLSFP